MRKKYTLKVYPAGMGRQVYRVLEISGDRSLDDLCSLILSAFDFIHEHLYEFCMDNRMYSDCSYQYEPEDDAPSTSISLDEIGMKYRNAVKGTFLDRPNRFFAHVLIGDNCKI